MTDREEICFGENPAAITMPMLKSDRRVILYLATAKCSVHVQGPIACLLATVATAQTANRRMCPIEVPLVCLSSAAGASVTMTEYSNDETRKSALLTAMFLTRPSSPMPISHAWSGGTFLLTSWASGRTSSTGGRQ